MAHISPNAQVQTATIAALVKEQVDPLFQESPIWAMIQKKGQIKYNCGGYETWWNVRYKRRSIHVAGDPLAMDFPATNTKKRCEVPYRAYQLGESISKFSQLASQNDPNAFYNILEDAIKETMEDFRIDLASKWTTDGAATGSQELHGIESVFNASAVAENARVGTPTGTYAGLNTALAAYGGSWTAEDSETWPTGSGDEAYCFFSPLEVDYTNAKFLSSTATWAGQWQEVVNWGITFQKVLHGKKPDLIVITPLMMLQAKQSFEADQSFEVTQNKTLIDAGIDAMAYMGVDFLEDMYVPAGVGYGIRFDKIRLHVMGKKLVEMDEDFDLTTKNKRIGLDSHLQMIWESPAFQTKFLAIS
jgi:hypothetical protein